MTPPTDRPEHDRLDSWKEIAAYLKRGVRTVQRWEQAESLPVHRLGAGGVHAYKPELDEWWQRQSRRLSAEPEALEPVEAATPRSARLLIVAGFAAAVAVAIAFLLGRMSQPPPTGDLTAWPLTVDHGKEMSPVFSPDGEQVAYMCSEVDAPSHICVKSIGGSTHRRLSQDPRPEGTPAWSPDGRTIAFLRAPADLKTPYSVMLVPASGGQESEVARTDQGSILGWSPDGLSLLLSEPAAGIVALSVSTGIRQVLVGPEPFPYAARITPDLRRVVYVRAGAVGQASIFEQPLGAGLKPEGKERRIAGPVWLGAVTILPNGEEIIYEHGISEESSAMWRMRLSRPDAPVRLLAGLATYFNPAVSPDGRRLAFAAHRVVRNEIWSVNLTGRGTARRFISSTHSDMNPNWSPDGKWIAFHSTRAGNSSDIWIADARGENARRLTYTNARTTATPRWSPSGEHVAYESIVSGQWKVYVMRAAGGPAQLITDHPSMNAFPSWSRDGKWIYFMSDRSGQREIWKTAFPGGGAPVQVTQGGGAVGFESMDGRYLYYSRTRDSGPLMRLALGSTALPEKILPVVRGLFFAVAKNGVYYLERQRQIHFWNASTRRSEEVHVAEANFYIGLALSPDEKTLLYTQTEMKPPDLYWADLGKR